MLSTLYKLTSTGAVQFWTIRVSHENDVSYLVTTYGQLNTDSPQLTRDPIRSGKNIGRANATSREQQAEAEALAKWQKQKKKGYVKSIEAAKAGEVDALIEGGISPMLAHKFADHGHKIITPCYIQPKIDGIRCIAIIDCGNVSLWTRTRKPIRSVPHINEALKEIFYDRSLILDGELYNHELCHDFETIVSLVRQDDPDPRAVDLVEYHIYDLVNDREYEKRYDELNLIFSRKPKSPIFLVDTEYVDEHEISTMFKSYRDSGYEGVILRNATGRYVNKRSYDLQKLKEFDDGEFKVIGIEEGRGKLVGHVGAFVCRTNDGVEFLAKMAGDTGKLKEYFENHSLWKNKNLTVRYQGFTKAGSPRFPVGVVLRDYE
jgi:ATP-dependent DNA ligase